MVKKETGLCKANSSKTGLSVMVPLSPAVRFSSLKDLKYTKIFLAGYSFLSYKTNTILFCFWYEFRKKKTFLTNMSKHF